MARRSALVLAWAAATALTCVRNPATGKRQLSLVSEEQEIQLGKEAAQQVTQTMAQYPDEKVQAYVRELGMKLAKASERPDLPWQFTVIDDPTVNAFALPGGPIFVTRGILTHINSEAELASVLGHEIGHVTARHSVEQLSKQQLAQLGLVAGMMISPEIAKVGQAAAAGLQLLFLKYGRDAERQADKLGFRYMVEQRYDPREMAKLFRVLERTSESSGQGHVPAWASTHPDPGEREKTAEERAATVTDPAALTVASDRYLPVVEGMVFGEDPRQGFFRGDTFLHPALEFQVTLPAGWKRANTPAALVAVSPDQDAAIQLTVAGKDSPEEAAKKFFSQQGVQGGALQRGTVNGLAAVASSFQAQTEQGPLAGVVSFVAHRGATYQLVGYAPAQRFAANDAKFRATIQSFGPLTDRSALAVQPAKVQLVKVPRDMTIEEFAREFPSTVPVEQVAIVNGIEKDGRLQGGQAAKRIVGGTPAEGAGGASADRK
jgi:predicted Zn-dependent protease